MPQIGVPLINVMVACYRLIIPTQSEILSVNYLKDEEKLKRNRSKYHKVSKSVKNPYMKEKMQVETEINKINLLKGNWLDNKEKYKIRIENLPTRIEKLEKSIENIKLDIDTYKANENKDFEIILNNIKFNDKTEDDLGEKLYNQIYSWDMMYLIIKKVI